VTASSQTNRSHLRSQSLLWVGPLLPPMGWFGYLLVNYMLVPYACRTGSALLLYVTTLVALLMAASAGIVAWRIWQGVEPRWPDEADGMLPRNRFLAVLGLFSSGLFFLVILAQGIPTLILHPCQL
jgi:hypothetical protein